MKDSRRTFLETSLAVAATAALPEAGAAAPAGPPRSGSAGAIPPSTRKSGGDTHVPATKEILAMNSPHVYERLTRDNAVLLLVDHQVGLYTGVRDIETLELKHNVVGLTKAALALKVPVIVTTTTEKLWGPLIPELAEALPGVKRIERTTVNPWDERRVADAARPPHAYLSMPDRWMFSFLDLFPVCGWLDVSCVSGLGRPVRPIRLAA